MDANCYREDTGVIAIDGKTIGKSGDEFACIKPSHIVTALEKDHGRIEEHEIWVTSDLERLGDIETWKGLKSLICVRSKRHEKGKASTL